VRATLPGSNITWRQVKRTTRPAEQHEPLVAAAVGFEGAAGGVRVAAVDFDDQPSRAPQEVGLGA